MAELIRQYVPRRVAARAGQDDGSPESFETIIRYSILNRFRRRR